MDQHRLCLCKLALLWGKGVTEVHKKSRGFIGGIIVTMNETFLFFLSICSPFPQWLHCIDHDMHCYNVTICIALERGSAKFQRPV